MSVEGPFSDWRREYEESHIYFLPKFIRRQLEAPNPSYILGSRGTGKTTLLRSLSWSERLTNHSLQAALGGEPFRDHLLGVYVKISECPLTLFDHWLEPVKDDIYGGLVGLYLDAVFLEPVLKGVEALRVENILNFSMEAERTATEALTELAKTAFGSLAITDVESPSTLAEALRMITQLRHRLQRCGQMEVDPSEVLGALTIDRPGALTRGALDVLGQLCSDGMEPRPAWRFYLCMDEAEALTHRQQLVVNTMVRLSKHPGMFVAAYMTPPKDDVSTIIPGLTLDLADRPWVRLEEQLSRKRFKEFVTGVSQLRFARELPSDAAVDFDVDRILGKLDLNGYLVRRLSASTGAREHARLEAARQLLGDEPYRTLYAGTERVPVYESFLLDTRAARPLDSSDPAWKRGGDVRADYRKKMVAAYLSICHELGVRPIYASGTMVLRMSDHCIRDYIWQMRAILSRYLAADGATVEGFLHAAIPPELQDESLRASSDAKFGAALGWLDTRPQETKRLVEGLARLTADLQTRSSSGRHLGTTERGIFILAKAQASLFPEEELPVFDMIRDAAAKAYLRLLKEDDSAIRFRVHASLAPAFGFSYRGAYYGVHIDAHDLLELAKAPQPDLERRVQNLAERLDAARAERPRRHDATATEGYWEE